MDSQTFNQLLDRLIMYIDTLDAEPTDARLVVDSVTQSLMNVIPQPEQIDYPNISPEQPTQGDRSRALGRKVRREIGRS